MNNIVSSLRWDPYFMKHAIECENFWRNFLSCGRRDILYVLGNGFDPRMCLGYEKLLEFGGMGLRNCLLLSFDEGSDSPSKQYLELTSQNKQKLETLVHGHEIIDTKPIQMWLEDGLSKRRNTSLNATRIFQSISDFGNYTDIIIDISAVPRSIYWSLISKVLYLLDKYNNQDTPNLHIFVLENAYLDQDIHEIGIDDSANYIQGFSGGLNMQSTEEVPRVWIPILGEDQRKQLERIHTLINPDEICPMLPWPSSDPRRCDKLFVEYQDLLFDAWHAEPRNIIYASEQNPFDAYRQIYKTVCDYNKALELLGGCKSVISALSSKLLSIGALLAAYELKANNIRVGLAHVEVQGYEISKHSIDSHMEWELFTIWLAGDCYED